MKAEIINNTNLKNELFRWSIQLLLVIFSIPYLLIVIGTPLLFLPIKQNFNIVFFISIYLYLIYYLLSVYFHFKTDKIYTFKEPWLNSNRVFASLYLIVIFIFFLFLSSNNVYYEADIGAIITFFLFNVIYTWMLSEYISQKLKSDRNLAFNYSVWYSRRFIVFIIIFFLHAFCFLFSSTIKIEIDNVEHENNIIIVMFLNIIFFLIYPFLILNLFAELKNRSLNRQNKKIVEPEN